MQEMIYSDNPAKFGLWKNTKYGSAYVAELNSYRLAYMINYVAKTIETIRVGDHKEVWKRLIEYYLDNYSHNQYKLNQGLCNSMLL